MKRLLPSREGVRRGRELARACWRGIALAARAAPATAAAFALVALAGGLLPVAQAWLVKLVVDGVATGGLGAEAGIVWLAALYAGTLVAVAALEPVRLALGARMEDLAVAEVDRAMMAAGERLVDLERIERPAFGDELRRLVETPYWLPRLFPALQSGLSTAITLGGLLALLGGLHPLLPLALLLLGAPHLVADHRMHGLQYEAMADRSRAAREMEYCLAITTQPDAAKEVRVFGLGPFFLERYRARFADALRELTRLRLRQLRWSALFSGLYALALGAGFLYVAAQAGAGRLTLGDIALYIGVVIQAQDSGFYLRVWWGIVYEASLHLRGFFRFLDGAAPGVRLPPPGAGVRAPEAFERGVALRDVSFRYPEGAAAVLDGLGLRLRAGEVTALVGANGAGKSTLVKLLTRMYDPTEGEIALDDRPLAAYDLPSLRSRVATAYQDFARFSLPLGENIRVGAPPGGAGDAEIALAAERAGADAVAAKLPLGYATELTRRFEGGVELSGGEWQRVALARAFVRDAPLVILDEPTAALDADAEAALFARFRALAVGRTGLLISHRFSTVRMADRIVVIEDGRIAEEGTHDELIRRGGRYAALWEMQAGRYREGR